LGRRRRGSLESEDLPVALHTDPLAEGGIVAKRLLVLVALLLVLPATALAATVHVRIEGKTKNLFAPQEATVTAGNALEALQQASLAGEFYYHITQSSFGNYVDQVGFYGGTADSGWVFKVNDVSPPVAADQVALKDGDHVLWYYATFGPTGGPPTLEVKASGKGCYTATAFDDTGKATAVTGLVWHVGSQKSLPGSTVKSLCPGAHPGVLVRATATGAIRSNAVK
jgi:hypothetical protein